MWTSALFSAVFFMVALAIGDFISKKTKGIFISTLTLSVIYIVGYFTGIIPKGSVEDIGFSKILSAFGLFAIITNLGTMLELRKFLTEWRTVLVCIGALLAVGLGFVTVGSLLFGKEYALVAYPPVAGGSVSTIMISDAAIAAGKPLLSSYAWLVGILQFFVGLPLTSILLQRYCKKCIKTGAIEKLAASAAEGKPLNLRIIPQIPEGYNTNYVVLAKLLLVTQLAVWLGSVTPIPAAVLCLVLGVLFCELGFLDKSSLQKSGMMNFLVLCLLQGAPASFSTLSLDGLKDMIGPVVFFLLFGGVLLAAGGAIVGKLFKYDMRMAAALGLSAMYGFPYSMLIPEQVIGGLSLPEEQAQKLSDAIIPKMVIAGFTTVTICSVIIAGIVCPLAFG